MRFYKNRKTQIAAIAREARLDLDLAAARRFHKALRDAAMVGAAEERARTLEILRTGLTPAACVERITAKSVLSVLGYA